jgi:aryl-alcohol dehydrogenase-like predicted oxidoreductase
MGERIARQLHASLERLGVGHVELYLAHEFDPDVPLPETLGAFEQARASGAIGAYGVSNFTAAQLDASLAAGAPSAVQNSCSLLVRRQEQDVLARAPNEASLRVQPARAAGSPASTAAASRSRPAPDPAARAVPRVRQRADLHALTWQRSRGPRHLDGVALARCSQNGGSRSWSAPAWPEHRRWSGGRTATLTRLRWWKGRG